MAHTDITWNHGRGAILVDGVRIPRITHATLELDASGLATLTVRMLADDVQVEAEADVVVDAQPLTACDHRWVSGSYTTSTGQRHNVNRCQRCGVEHDVDQSD